MSSPNGLRDSLNTVFLGAITVLMIVGIGVSASGGNNGSVALDDQTGQITAAIEAASAKQANKLTEETRNSAMEQIKAIGQVTDALTKRTEATKAFAAALTKRAGGNNGNNGGKAVARINNAHKAAALSGLLAKGAEVHRHFAVGDQLIGWDITFKDSRDVYYTTADGKYLLLGAVLDSHGKNISAQDRAGNAGNAPKPSAKPAAQAQGQDQGTLDNVYAQFEKADTIDWGNADKPEMYVIFEPNCPFCSRLDTQLKDHADDVSIHYVPVAFLSPQSPAAAAILLQADDVRGHLDSLEKISRYEGDLTPWVQANTPDDGVDDVTDELQHNAYLMHQAGVSGTPAIVYKDTDGTVHLHKGMPRPGALTHILKTMGAK